MFNAIWDSTSAHCGQVVREYLSTPGPGLQLVNLTGCGPDFNPNEAIQQCVRKSMSLWRS